MKHLAWLAYIRSEFFCHDIGSGDNFLEEQNRALAPISKYRRFSDADHSHVKNSSVECMALALCSPRQLWGWAHAYVHCKSSRLCSPSVQSSLISGVSDGSDRYFTTGSESLKQEGLVESKMFRISAGDKLIDYGFVQRFTALICEQ